MIPTPTQTRPTGWWKLILHTAAHVLLSAIFLPNVLHFIPTKQKQASHVHMSNGACLVFLKMRGAGRKWSSILGLSMDWPLNSLCPHSHKCLMDAIRTAGNVPMRLFWSRNITQGFFFFCCLIFRFSPSFHWQSSQLHKYTVWPQGADGREQQSCTYPSLCNVICRTAFARRSTARTEARLTCVRCVRSQGRQRHHKCSGTWWSQNCPWWRRENDTSERGGGQYLNMMRITLFICKRESIRQV